MKKATSIALSALIVLSLFFAAYASGNADNGNGKNKETKVNAKGTPAAEVTPATAPADTLESLTEQLKAGHKDEAVRKELHSKIKELRRQQGDKTIPVLVNGQLVKFDVPPVVKNNRTLIPVRGVSNALGASVVWDGDTGDVTITKVVYSSDTSVVDAVYSTTVVVIDLDTGKFYKDGAEMQLDVPAQVMNNRTFVPIRFLAEAFGLKVGWDDDLDGVVVEDEDEVIPSPAPTAVPTATPVPSPTASPVT